MARLTAEARDFQTQSDLRTLAEAEQIRTSKTRMSAVTKMAKRVISTGGGSKPAKRTVKRAKS